jgi:subtilisin-like proprotein convertase family protein
MNPLSRKRLVAVAIAIGALTVTAVALAATFTNATPIAIGDAGTKPTPASPYPSAIAVSGLTGTIGDVNVTLNNFTHSAPDDVDVLVTSPAGGKVLIMSDAGDTFPVSQSSNLTFDDGAPTSLPDDTAITAGAYKPSNYGSSGGSDPFCTGEPDPEVFPAPAPGPTYSAALAAFNTQAPNGTWNIYITDDCAGGSGSFAGGWTLDITTTPTAVTVASLTSEPVKGGVRVRWRTSAETQIAGFNVYRAKARLNQHLIAARHSGLAQGSGYTLVDRAARKGRTYTYRLQVVGLDGKGTWFGATSIHLPD